jgi:hypothetical protein
MPSPVDLQPVRRPTAWNDVSTLAFLSGEPRKFFISPETGAFADQARRQGLSIAPSPPSEVIVVEGEWPGIRISDQGGRADAGPTGAPWISANYWRVQLARTKNPGKPVWVAASPPEKPRLVSPESYVLALADAAAAGGKWIVELADAHARQIADGKPEVWRSIENAAQFFHAHRDWAEFGPGAAMGVISDFSETNEFLATEILNLTARQHQPFRVLMKSKVEAASLRGLKAVVYADAEAPPPEMRKLLLAYAGGGGLVVAGPSWGASQGAASHPRFRVASVGKGTIAAAPKDFDDPYLIASDTQILMSHRHDPVRLWNAGSLGSHYTVSADGRQAVLHLINFSARRRDEPVSVWLARPYRTARWWRIDSSQPATLKLAPQQGGVEIHLPPVPVYAAIELTA